MSFLDQVKRCSGAEYHLYAEYVKGVERLEAQESLRPPKNVTELIEGLENRLELAHDKIGLRRKFLKADANCGEVSCIVKIVAFFFWFLIRYLFPKKALPHAYKTFCVYAKKTSVKVAEFIVDKRRYEICAYGVLSKVESPPFLLSQVKYCVNAAAVSNMEKPPYFIAEIGNLGHDLLVKNVHFADRQGLGVVEGPRKVSEHLTKFAIELLHKSVGIHRMVVECNYDSGMLFAASGFKDCDDTQVVGPISSQRTVGEPDKYPARMGDSKKIYKFSLEHVEVIHPEFSYGINKEHMLQMGALLQDDRAVLPTLWQDFS